MEQVVLDANSRTPGGKIGARKIRHSGAVPGVVYGHGLDPQTLSVDTRTLETILRHNRGGNVLFKLTVDGSAPEGLAAIVKELQTNPVTDEFLSIDFQWVSLTETVTVTVAVHFTGESSGALKGGSVDQILYDVPVSCLPLAIPEQLTLDITGMAIGDTRHVSDLVVPEGVEVQLEPEEAIVTVRAPIAIEEPEVEGEEGLEGEEGAKGEEGAAPDDADGADEGGEGE